MLGHGLVQGAVLRADFKAGCGHRGRHRQKRLHGWSQAGPCQEDAALCDRSV